MRWLDRITFEICTWWTGVRMRRANPRIRSLETQIAAARRAHRPRLHLIKELRDIRTQMLREGA